MGVQPAGDKLNVVYIDTCTLVAYTVKDDSIRTDNTVYNLLGSNNDPVFGKNTASFYSQVLLSQIILFLEQHWLLLYLIL